MIEEKTKRCELRACDPISHLNFRIRAGMILPAPPPLPLCRIDRHPINAQISMQSMTTIVAHRCDVHEQSAQ